MQVLLYEKDKYVSEYNQNILRYFQDPWEVCQDFRKQTIHQEQQAVAPQTTVREICLDFQFVEYFMGEIEVIFNQNREAILNGPDR